MKKCILSALLGAALMFLSLVLIANIRSTKPREEYCYCNWIPCYYRQKNNHTIIFHHISSLMAQKIPGYETGDFLLRRATLIPCIPRINRRPYSP